MTPMIARRTAGLAWRSLDSLLHSGGMRDHSDLPQVRPAQLFWGGLALEVSLVGVAAAIGWIALDDPFPFRIALDARGFLLGALATLPILAYMVFSLSPLGRSLRPLEQIYELLRALIARPLCEMPAWQLVTLGVAAGVGEEVLFRGVLQPWVSGWTSPWAAVAILALVFGLFHALTLAYFALAAAISIYFGWLVIAVENLLVPILAHGLYDAAGFLLLRARFRRERLPAGEELRDGEARETALLDDALGAAEPDTPAASAPADPSLDPRPGDANDPGRT
jgi:hypothetical protein